MDFLQLAKTNVNEIKWINEFNPKNIKNYENNLPSSENYLDKSEILTAEECSTILLEKMKILRQLYVQNLHSIKQEYIKEYTKYRAEIFQESNHDDIKKPDKELMRILLHYHRSYGKLGDYHIRSRNRRWQFVNFFSPIHKYLRKKYQSYIFGGYNTSLSKLPLSYNSNPQITQVQCHFRNNLDEKSSHSNGIKSFNGNKKGSKVNVGKSRYCGKKGNKSESPIKKSSTSKFSHSFSSSIDLNRCPHISLPFSNYCHLHILQDANQILFSTCNTTNATNEFEKFEGTADSKICEYPLLNISMYDKCPLHFKINEQELS